MRRIITCGLFGLMLTLGASAGVRQAPAGLQGNWEVVEAEISGKKSKTAAGATWQFQERAVIVTSKAGKMVTYPYRTDTAKTPTQIDVQPAAGVGLQKSKQGIIQIDGDTLKICFAQPTVKGVERPRPTAFMTMPGDGCILYVMKRVK